MTDRQNLQLLAARSILLTKKYAPHPTLSRKRMADMTDQELHDLIEWHKKEEK